MFFFAALPVLILSGIEQMIFYKKRELLWL